MYKDRKSLYQQLEQERSSKVLVYVTGDRQGLETQIHPEVYDFFVNHLDKFGVVPKISLYLYTRGGLTLAAWSLVNLIRLFCDKFEVIVPSKAHSAGTLICLGADCIVMTKQATLGPIDPSVNTALNPQIPGAAPGARVPVSVEAISGFLELAKGVLGIHSEEQSAKVLIALAQTVHPLVLGEVYRSRSQIKMLAGKLVSHQVKQKKKQDAVIAFLCSESGSHDYTIHRREAKETLGLKVEKPTDALYKLIKTIYDDISSDMQFASKYDPNSMLAGETAKPYLLRRAVVESVSGGCDVFVSEGTLRKNMIQVPQGGAQMVLQDERVFEGWRHENG
jgi:hypothetical protein